MRILVIGAKGKLGGRLTTVLEAQGHDVHGVDIDTLDITHFDAVRETLHDLKPEMVALCAAWTDVDGCAREPERALHINGFGSGNVAVAAAEVGTGILYVSSNEVFDGKNQHIFTEYDATSPANPYGYSKYFGERAVIEATPKHMIVRTSWLFAHGGTNFIQAILNAANAGKDLRVVTDEVANPTYNDDLADALARLMVTGRWGTFHLTNTGAVSRYAFARYALDKAGHANTPIEKITRHQWPRPSNPPLYTDLRNINAAGLGITLRDWREAVDDFLRKENLYAEDAS